MRKGGVPSGQDWEPQVYHFNSAPKGKTGVLSAKEASQAWQKGKEVIIERREERANKQFSLPQKKVTLPETDDTVLTVKRVGHELRMRIMKERQALKWSQQDLAQRISERVSVVSEYESGKAVPEERVIVKMEKAFGVHLRGAKAGQPLGKSRPAPKATE